jgi:predicted membrane protein
LIAIGSSQDGPNSMARGGGVRLTPTSVDGIGDSYHQNFGDFTLDLRSVDFSKTTVPKEINVTMNAGNLTILVPPKVDTTVHAQVDLGDANVFDNKWGGVHSSMRDVADNDRDGAGGGTLILDIQLKAGDLEVRR